MLDGSQPESDSCRTKLFHIRLEQPVFCRLERAAAARNVSPEILLAAIGRVVVTDHLIDAVLDDDKLL